MTRADVDAPAVDTTSGRVRGLGADGIFAYLGIPYAAPPIGAAAFAAPAPPAAWDGVQPATEYGPTAPQVGYPAPIAALLDNTIVLGDDYLNLNVWTPDPSAGGLPVMVWIHGGAFTRGSNRIEMYAGDTFARDGVVCVGINYRLGTAGFASIEGAPDNRGLLDQIAALGWVSDNIAAFGGDPDNVTVFGESAGAMSIASLLASPLATGLFRRAIMQSGNGSAAADPTDARKVTARLAEILDVDASVEALGRIGVDDMLRAQSTVALELMLDPNPEVWGPTVVDVGMGIMSQFPVVDGEVLPAVPCQAIAAGAGADIPLLAGWNADEFRFFMVATGGAQAVTEEGAAAVLGRAPGGLDHLRTRLAAGASAGDVLSEALTARAFSSPTTEIAESRPTGSTYLYEFGYRSPQADIQAGHAVEIPFVFDHLAAAHALVGPEPDQRIADDMHDAWVRFASTGGPGWPAHGGGEGVRRFV
ncbi:carboxylesterase family protein [Gordonia sp. Z-3]|uniref:Carboxylic ester hydrolase n=1 Tax=Gordonia aquimaris TaxID=2984863 RepID=A0A9X3D8C1_9ACTN|nr:MULTISPECIES: carboxylesterase family protein [Gordonia]MCX2965512.1 carboxylesterase family protein [Gordonia aquimaris]MED5800261.1 carboxylesterase family protein [Gordonia sp. Z-3]